MLKRDPPAKFVCRTVGSFPKQLFYRFHAGKKRATEENDNYQHRCIWDRQKNIPVDVCYDTSNKRTWWMFRNEFYWEDEGLSGKQVMALILDKIQQKERKIENAIARTSEQKQKITSFRQPMSSNVKTYVWQRDGGRCVICGSKERLEFDHIIPIAKRGSNTARNIQLLCEKCNRIKGTTL
jgi:hypothetical protein